MQGKAGVQKAVNKGEKNASGNVVERTEGGNKRGGGRKGRTPISPSKKNSVPTRRRGVKKVPWQKESRLVRRVSGHVKSCTSVEQRKSN